MINTVMSLAANLDKSQWLPMEIIEQIEQDELVKIVQHHAEHTPWFTARLQEQNLAPSDISTLKSLKRYRPFTKRDIQRADNFKSNTVPDVYKPIGYVESSGSTGQPVSIDRTSINNVFWAAHTLRDHSWFNRDFTHKLASIRATFQEGEVYRDNWGAPVAIICKDNGPGLGIPVNWGTNRQLQAMVTIWERDGCKLTNLKHIKQIGDTVHEPLRERVRTLFGLEIEDNYSSSEVGCIAMQCPVSGLYHIMAENLIVEILDADGNDCKPGEIGRVVVTDLSTMLLR
jgi:phenylacetate-CoA ligase